MDPARLQPAPISARARLHLSKESMAFAARLEAAEAAVRRQDHRTAAHLLHRAPSLLQGTGDGRVLELMAVCAEHSADHHAADPWPLWQRCLAAYQEAHDSRGCERAHRAVGLWARGRGELFLAAQHLRRAQQLLLRQLRPEAAVEGWCQQAEVAMAQGQNDIHSAYGWAEEAALQCQSLSHAGLLESRARLMRARASCLMGAVAEAALDMLWAERAAAPFMPQRGSSDPWSMDALGLMMCRAESLLLLGHPRRAATCLSTIQPAAQAVHHQGLLARFRLLVCQAFRGDQPHVAHAAGVLAQAYYRAHKQPYWRVACDIALVRSAHQLSHDDTAHRMQALTALNMERWPLLAFALQQAQEDVAAPQHHALGAVRTPWMRAVGHIDVGPRKNAVVPSEDSSEGDGFFARLGHVIGRVAKEDADHDSTQRIRS